MIQAITIKENEQFLRQVSKNVDLQDENLESELALLKEYTLSHDVWAMASVQIGIPKRLVFVKSTNPTSTDNCEENHLMLINPTIISQKGRTTFWEACASCQEFCSLVERPYEIVVQYQALDGKLLTQTFTGFSATVLSHEIDHLDGILHMDRATKVVKLSKEDRKTLRLSEPYKIISEDCEFSYSQNQTIKEISHNL